MVISILILDLKILRRNSTVVIIQNVQIVCIQQPVRIAKRQYGEINRDWSVMYVKISFTPAVFDATCVKNRSCHLQSWTCDKCLLSKLPFFGQDFVETTLVDSTMLNDYDNQNDVHLTTLQNNAKHLKIMHINTLWLLHLITCVC